MVYPVSECRGCCPPPEPQRAGRRQAGGSADTSRWSELQCPDKGDLQLQELGGQWNTGRPILIDIERLVRKW